MALGNIKRNVKTTLAATLVKKNQLPGGYIKVKNVVVKMLDCDIVLIYYVPFCTNAPWKRYEPLYPPLMLRVK